MSGSRKQPDSNSPKRERTEQGIVSAFNRVFLREGDKPVYVNDIVREGDIGRSTFYEYFSSAEDALLKAAEAPLATIADSMCALESEESLEAVLRHVHENRAQADRIFNDARLRDRFVSVLAESLYHRSPADIRMDLASERLQLRLAAESVIALIRFWLSGQLEHTASEMAHEIMRVSARFGIQRGE